MDKLLRDSTKTEISNKVMDILRAYHISNRHSELYHKNQNPAEWRYRTIKSWTNTVMNRSGAPANCWLLCLIYVCYLLNHIACTALDGKIPLLALTGISTWVLCHTYDQKFPSESEERAGYWVGFGEHCGDAMTHKILYHDTQKLSIEELLDPRSLPPPTIGLYHMEGRFLHLLTLLMINFPLDHHLDPQKVTTKTEGPYVSCRV